MQYQCVFPDRSWRLSGREGGREGEEDGQVLWRVKVSESVGEGKVDFFIKFI